MDRECVRPFGLVRGSDRPLSRVGQGEVCSGGTVAPGVAELRQMMVPLSRVVALQAEGDPVSQLVRPVDQDWAQSYALAWGAECHQECLRVTLKTVNYDYDKKSTPVLPKGLLSAFMEVGDIR